MSKSTSRYFNFNFRIWNCRCEFESTTTQGGKAGVLPPALCWIQNCDVDSKSGNLATSFRRHFQMTLQNANSRNSSSRACYNVTHPDTHMHAHAYTHTCTHIADWSRQCPCCMLLVFGFALQARGCGPVDVAVLCTVRYVICSFMFTLNTDADADADADVGTVLCLQVPV